MDAPKGSITELRLILFKKRSNATGYDVLLAFLLFSDGGSMWQHARLSTNHTTVIAFLSQGNRTVWENSKTIPRLTQYGCSMFCFKMQHNMDNKCYAGQFSDRSLMECCRILLTPPPSMLCTSSIWK